MIEIYFALFANNNNKNTSYYIILLLLVTQCSIMSSSKQANNKTYLMIVFYKKKGKNIPRKKNISLLYIENKPNRLERDIYFVIAFLVTMFV
jgi:hypothetical protein